MPGTRESSKHKQMNVSWGIDQEFSGNHLLYPRDLLLGPSLGYNCCEVTPSAVVIETTQRLGNQNPLPHTRAVSAQRPHYALPDLPLQQDFRVLTAF